MKIVRLSTFLDFGGIESKMVKISNYNDLNNEWIFCALGKGGEAEKEIKNNNKRVICFNRPYKIPSISTIIQLYKFFKDEKPEVVHSSGAEANFHGVIAAKLAGVPKIITEEIGIPKHSLLAKIIFKGIFKISNKVLGESFKVTENLREEYKISSSKVYLVPNFINPSFTLNTAIRNREFFRLVSISRLEPVKNIQSILHVIAKLKKEKENILLTIVGEGSQRQFLESLTEQLQIKENIIFTGYQSNPIPYLIEADVYILTSLSEGASNSLLEAMSCATPSLSTNVGSAEEMINDGFNGFLVEPNEDNMLYSKLKDILCLSSEDLKRIGSAGRKTVNDNYSLESHIETLMGIYKN